MNRKFLVTALAIVVAVPALAQAPKGFTMRLDRSTSASDPDAPGEVKVEKMGPGFHVTAPKAAVIWSADSVAKGTYTLAGTFHLMKPSGHANYYGLVFGGDALDAATQNYLYFLVAQNGTFIVKHRAGDATTHDVVGRTPNAAIKQPGADGSSANALEVRVGADKIDYVVNGTVVHTTPKSGMTAKTDGTFGVRINHQLEVHVEKFGIAK